MNEILYYVIKYDGKYYAPYLTVNAYAGMSDIDAMLTHDRNLALRFPSREVADFFLDKDKMYRAYDVEQKYDPKMARVVRVVKKIKNSY